MKKKIILIVLIFILIALGIITIKLVTNKTFFSTTYIGVNNQEIFIPKYSYFKKEGGMTVATFKSLRSKEKLDSEIKKYMDEFEYFEDDTTYGYRKGNLLIQSYSVIDEGLLRIITITYDSIYENKMQNDILKIPRGITIYTGENVENIQDEYTYDILEDEETIKNAKEQLNKVFNRYPKGFWEELLLENRNTKHLLKIYLVGEIHGTRGVSGFATQYNNDYYVYVDINHVGPEVNIEGIIFHELMHIIDFYLSDIGEVYEDWYDYLPDNFNYTGYVYEHTQSEFKMTIYNETTDDNVWFDSIYAVETELEDRACIMQSIYYEGLSSFKKYPHLYKRMNYVLEVLSKNFKTIKNDTTNWQEVQQ